MNETVTQHWKFGGPLADVEPDVAWTLLAVAFGLCLLAAWWSYRHAIRALSWPKCFTLVALRTVFLATLIACLANPVEVRRSETKPPEPPPGPPRKLALVIDRSDSMTQADNRGRTRLDDALTTWRRFEKSAETAFAETQHYSFANDLRPAPTFEAALARTGETGETRLYQSVASILKEPPERRPDAVVVITDGLDTSYESDTLLRDSALAAGVPVYFVAGSNRTARPEPFLRVRDWRAPGTVMRNSEFALEATFEAFSREARNVPYSLWQGSTQIDSGSLDLAAGSNLIPRQFSVNAGEPGLLNFTLQLGDGSESQPVARSTTRVVGRRAIRVLFYQGALDWGFRYFTDALRTDASFEFSTLLNPAVRVTLASAQPGQMEIGQLPEDAGKLQDFDCIVLAHLYPNQLTAGQQQALIAFTRAGGSVLFVSPDREAIPQFAWGPLQELLPVVFAPVEREPLTAANALRVIRRGGRSRFEARENKREAVQLSSFALTDAGRASPIFSHAGGEGPLTPRFLEFASIARAKPGAEVLAVHPTERDAEGQPRILLAVETFGRGRSALLATDALWRWKLSEPSMSRVVETFWQQLLLAIGRRKEESMLHFAHAPAQVRVGDSLQLRLAGTGEGQRPVVTAKSPDGRTVSLPVQATEDPETPWSVEWKADNAGTWELIANAGGDLRAHVFATAVNEPRGEQARTPPALDPLRTLAGETGGALLVHEPPAAWRLADAPQQLKPIVSERHQLRWNHWLILSTALGIYALELLLRRGWKLL